MKSRNSCPPRSFYAHRLVHRQADFRKDKRLPWLQPDAKSQVTFRYVDGQPEKVEAVVFSTQHDADVEYERLKKEVLRHIIDPVIPEHLRVRKF